MSNECRLRLEWVPEAYKDTAGLSDKSLKRAVTDKSFSMVYDKPKIKAVYGFKNKSIRQQK